MSNSPEPAKVKPIPVKPVHLKSRLALILMLYLILAGAYSVVVPIGRGADEWAHYWYAQFIAEHGRLPANPAERESAGYKSDWPPLYHLLAAAATGWIDAAGPPTFKYRLDPATGAAHFRRQLIPAQGPDAILHTEDELFPWRQEILIWHLGRFLSIGFSLGALLVTYWLALEVFQSNPVAGSRGAGEQGGRGAGEQGGRGREDQASPITPYALRLTYHASRFTPQTLALISVACLAFIPRFLFTSMVFGYDSLTLLLASLFLWLAIRTAQGQYQRWSFWALGAIAGLALVTKYLTALLPLEIGFLAFLRPGQTASQASASNTSRGEQRNSPLLPRPPAPLLKLGQATLTFLLVASWWFGYLLINFNEIGAYGPVLGSLAPLLRGDGSDRTVEQLFAWLSGGQAPPPAPLNRPGYTPWQLIAGFFSTFWGNPLTQPYPLTWFVATATVVAVVAVAGLALSRRTSRLSGSLLEPSNPPALQPSGHPLASLLLLHCLLPVPFMLIRLFGARDALEAVQGRHLLFLSGPAIAILLVSGIVNVTSHVSRLTPRASRLTLYALPGLLLTGSIGQLIYMQQIYPPPLPVRTTPDAARQVRTPSAAVVLPGGSRLAGYDLSLTGRSNAPFAPAYPALQVALIWQGGAGPAPEDYRLELALVDEQGDARTSWLAYQTQARYPTRSWEAGDTIRDEGWLPLVGLPAGAYEIRWRLLAEKGTVLDWQTLATYVLTEPASQPARPGWLLWRDGAVAPSPPPLFHERETAQLTLSSDHLPLTNYQLLDPHGLAHPPASAGATWANFIIGPDWPAGDYRLVGGDGSFPVLRVAENGRNFSMPAITQPLQASFEDQIKLLGYDLPSRRVQPGEGLPVTLYWQGLRWLGEDFVIFARLLDNQGLAWGGYDRRARENYSTLLWAPGEVIADGLALPVAPDAPNGVYTLSLGWYRRVNGEAKSLSVLDPASGQPTGATAVTIGPVKVGDPPPGATVAAASPQIGVNIMLGEHIKLLGFDFGEAKSGASSDGATIAPSSHLPLASPLRLTLYWQALAAVEVDYTVFVHVRNSAGEIVAQKDSPPLDGAYPTSLWDAGEIIKDEREISLPHLPPGEYGLVVGMYDFTTGARLPVAGSPDGAILLRSFEVEE